MRKILTVLAALLLICGAVYAFGPVPGADNFLWVDQTSGSPRVNVLGANFHVSGSSAFDGATTFTGAVTLPASTSLTTPTFTSPAISSPTVSGLTTNTPQAFTVADNGGGTAATGTLTPTSNVVLVTCSDADGCTVTMGETGMASGMQVAIVNMSANTATFADTAGVSETTGSVALAQYDSLTLVYATDRWVELAASNN